jgi:hypothetical protein
MMPINVQFAYDKANKVQTEKIKKLNSSADPIPLQEETADKDLNKLIKSLLGQKERLKNEIKGAKNPDIIRIKLRNLSDTIKQVQLKKDVGFIFD